jgi:FkbM family methyltransferase
MNVGRTFTKLKKAFDLITLKSKASYSQSGEDLIIDYFFESIGIKQPAYIDIGANQPEKGNNTYLFYLKGSRGICIEPDITLIPALKKVRPKDLILNLGISMVAEDFADFYFFKEHYHTWNTFSKDDATKKSEESGLSFYSSKVKLDTINSITQRYHFEKVNYLSIDVEGLDLEVLKSIDFGRIKPELICVETIAFSMTNTLRKNQVAVDFMLSKDYLVYADTNLNTIFCRKDLFK